MCSKPKAPKLPDPTPLPPPPEKTAEDVQKPRFGDEDKKKRRTRRSLRTDLKISTVKSGLNPPS